MSSFQLLIVNSGNFLEYSERNEDNVNPLISSGHVNAKSSRISRSPETHTI